MKTDLEIDEDLVEIIQIAMTTWGGLPPKGYNVPLVVSTASYETVNVH